MLVNSLLDCVDGLFNHYLFYYSTMTKSKVKKGLKQGQQTTDLELWNRYFSEGKPIHLRNQLVLANINLVHKVCHQLKRTQKAFDVLEYNEMVNIASLGLISAIEKFQLKEGNYFLKFALPFINGRLKQYLRDKSRLIRFPVDKHDLIMRYYKIRESQYRLTGVYPTLKQVFLLAPTNDQKVGYEVYKGIIERWNDTSFFEKGRQKSTRLGSKTEEDDSIAGDGILDTVESKDYGTTYAGDTLPMLPRSLLKIDYRVTAILRELQRDNKKAKLFKLTH